jgi:hypothetical protein
MMRPESTPDPADAGCNSQLAQYSNTPILRVAGFRGRGRRRGRERRESVFTTPRLRLRRLRREVVWQQTVRGPYPVAFCAGLLRLFELR